GAATPVAGSALEAAAGVGALAVRGYGAASVGIAGIAGVVAPAVSSLGTLTEAQKAYTEAVKLYGPASKQAATALAKLHLEESKTGPAAIGLVRGLQSVEERWTSLTKAGRNSFFGLADEALDRLKAKLPLFAKSADTSMGALRSGLDNFLNKATGPGFDHFIEKMTGTFAKIVPQIGQGLGAW